MSDNLDDLDSFLNDTEPQADTKTEKKTATNQGDTNLEDEFSKLLNDFITQDMGETPSINVKQESEPYRTCETIQFFPPLTFVYIFSSPVTATSN